MARLFDDSYDTVEKRFRIYKKAGQKLIEEAEAAGRMDMNMKKGAAGSKKSTATPMKGGTSTPDCKCQFFTFKLLAIF